MAGWEWGAGERSNKKLKNINGKPEQKLGDDWKDLIDSLSSKKPVYIRIYPCRKPKYMVDDSTIISQPSPV
jgi:hypothetical protein